MKVVLFDGVCNLCNGSVNWLIDHDKNNVFKFASLQSDYGSRRVADLNLGGEYLNTVIFDNDGKVSLRSDAVLNILKQLGGIYSLASVFFIVPAFIRNYVYNKVAANRYKWFGKHDTCRVPTPDLKSKFLD
ncbi:MAG: DUF393 domain-containing protein [Chitinophagales bacterium]|nr:DUF393 domain-containing protein [Chitinophagales bacterium]